MPSFPENTYILGRPSCSFPLPDQFPSQYIGQQSDKHLLSIAPTRTGKGRGLILPNLLSLPDHSVFVIDPKGENALVSAKYRREQGHEVVIFNPHGIHAAEFEKRGFKQFQTFNPLINLDPKSPSFSDDITIIADALIYKSGGDSHWDDSAKGLIEFLIAYLITEPEEKDTRTLRRLRTLLSGGYPALVKIIKKAVESDNPLVSENAGRYSIETNEINSVIATAETQTRIFKSNVICSALEGNAFDFEQMKNRKISVYLILPSDRLSTQARYLRLILLTAMSHFMRSEEKGQHTVLMMLDEFANLGSLPIIENGYGLIAGYGVTLWSFVQNLTQLQNLYPKNWETFLANSGVVTVSNINDVTTAEYFSRRAAQFQLQKTSLGSGLSHVYSPNSLAPVQATTNNSSNINMVWEDNVPVTDLYEANSDTLFLFFQGHAKPTKCQKLFYDMNAPFNERAEPNPMHSSNHKPQFDAVAAKKAHL